MSGIENLDPSPWLIRTDDEVNEAYSLMRMAEDEWLEALREAGAAVHDMERRRYIALVPDAVSALPNTNDLENTRAGFRAAALKAAEEQGKKPTVTARSAQLPEWLGPGGGDIHEERPEYRAARVRYRFNNAWRGGRITPGQALSFIDERIASLEAAIDRATERRDSKARRDAQKNRLKALKKSRRIVAQFAEQGSSEYQYAARIRSGQALRISIYGSYTAFDGVDVMTTNVSAQAAVPAIGLIPIADTETCKLEAAGGRNRASNYELVADAHPVVILAKRAD